MKYFQGSAVHIQLMATTAIICAVAASPAHAQSKSYNVPALEARDGVTHFARAAQIQVLMSDRVARGHRTNAVRGTYSVEEALAILLRGTGLSYKRSGTRTYVIKADKVNAPAEPASRPQAEAQTVPPSDAASAAPVPAESAGEAIIVTAQRKEEKLLDVPIAMTALSDQALDDRKIEGGSELLRAVPNVNFSKTNFSMYNFSIRGVGTQSISASSDPAVAVSFNSTPLVRNRLFESEFFDMARVEVLRGPQGTLYGRNATAGVVNLIPALPNPRGFEGEIRGEVGSYSTTRLSGMVNLPVSNTLAVRVAGAWTKRDGFDYNSFTGRRVNGRDLWSTRASVLWEPSDRFKASLIWQHFEEDDDRSRTGKQLCHNDPSPTQIGNTPILYPVDAASQELIRAKFSQGCRPGSLYDDDAYGVPNGASFAFMYPTLMSIGRLPGTDPARPTRPGLNVPSLKTVDPLAGVTQSRNLREISTSYDPVFRAKNDVVQLNIEFKPDDALTFVSQTAYSRDRFYSSQDYNRFISLPLFNDSLGLVDVFNRPHERPGPTPGGIYCDKQLGCSDRMLSADLSQSRNRQWSQEFRLQSDFDGPVNFLVGANYLDFKSQDNYYVFNNLFTFVAEWFYSKGVGGFAGEPLPYGIFIKPCELGNETRECPYVDPNPIDKINNQGHNYFLSQNGIRIRSAAAFGEVYWKLNDQLKLTVGGRYTSDRKYADQIPSQLLLGGGIDNPYGPEFIGDTTGGRVNSGYPALDDINQKWGRFTGRIVLDWQPELAFTDSTLVYASASRGYKGGGTNPPRVDFNPNVVQYQYLPQTFRPEYVNAFEIGTKNSFDGGRFTLNASAFYYDYKDYQVSQIVDRIAYNENFDATSWGLELETAWRPSRSFRMDANLGYLRTRIGKGAQSIDVMDRTQGNPDWVVLRPWIQVPSNCVAPRALVEKILAAKRGTMVMDLSALCPGSTRIGTYNPVVDSKFKQYQSYGFTYDPFAPYNPATVGLNIDQGGSGAPNGGRGFYADLEGNELPNAPRMTFNLGAQYTFFLDNDDWTLTFRGDYYRQSKSFGRVYNTEYDRLRAWDNVNVAVTLARPKSGFTLQAYVKNLFDKTPITGFFTNSDDTGLTTNVFTIDPRIVGLNASVKF